MTDAICKAPRRARTGMATVVLIAVGLPGCAHYRLVYPFQPRSVLGDNELWIRSADDREGSLLVAIGHSDEGNGLPNGQFLNISACFRYDPERRKLVAADRAAWYSARGRIIVFRHNQYYPGSRPDFELPLTDAFQARLYIENGIPAVGRVVVQITTCPRGDTVAVMSVEGRRFVPSIIPVFMFMGGPGGRTKVIEPCYLQLYSASDGTPQTKPVRLRIVKDHIPYWSAWSADSRYLLIRSWPFYNIFIFDTQTLEEIEVPEAEQSTRNAESE